MRKKSDINAVKERTLNAIRIDRQHEKIEIIREPLQPFLEFMLEVATKALAKKPEDCLTIKNENTGLKFQISKLSEEDTEENYSRYTMTLYNGNEIRFSGDVVNMDTLGENRWYFTQKYEDMVSKKDIEQFIKATSILYGQLLTENEPTMEDLIKWTMLAMKDNVKDYKYDDITTLQCSKDKELWSVSLIMNGIVLNTCTAYMASDMTYTIGAINIAHECPQEVINKLAEKVRNEAKARLTDVSSKRAKKAQEEFYNTHMGIRYSEQATLNDIFKNYA